MYYPLDVDLYSQSSQRSLLNRPQETPSKPHYELVKGLSSNYGRKLSSFYVIDEELCEMPFFDFEENRKTFMRTLPNDRSVQFWGKISQNILTPYVPNNRLLLNKYLSTQHSINRRNTVDKSFKNIYNTTKSYLRLTIPSKPTMVSHNNFIHISETLTKSFEEPSKPNFFNSLPEEFRRKSVYNSLEGEMTRKQAKYYKLLIDPKAEESSCSINLPENLPKKPSLSKKEAIQPKDVKTKVKLAMMGYIKNRPNEKKLNFLLNSKMEEYDSNASEIILKESFMKSERSSSIMPPITIKSSMKQPEITLKSPEIPQTIPLQTTQSATLVPSSNMLRSTSKSSYGGKEGDVCNPRKTMPNLVPQGLGFQILERKKTAGTIIISNENENENKNREFNSIIRRITGSHKKKELKTENNSVWTDTSELKTLTDYNRKMFQSFEEGKIKKREKINRFKESKDPSEKNFGKSRKELEIALEKEKRHLLEFVKLPKRSEIKSNRAVVNELYGLGPQKKKSK